MNQSEAINILAIYLGMRDIANLTTQELNQKYDIKKADICVLYGGSILQGGDEFAKAIKNKIAKHYIISGSHGHTTAYLRKNIQKEFSDLKVAELTEAQLFQYYLQKKYNVKADLLEERSTNCGNNVTYVLDLLKKNNIKAKKIIVMQDATMQRRMAAVFKKEAPEIKVINYASYRMKVNEQNDELFFENLPRGMWSMQHYVSLLLGEIPRLRDDENGYGPNGKNYLAHVSIPNEVEKSFTVLAKVYPDLIRTANSAYATK